MEDWDDLRFFLAVVRAGSLTGAARRLGCSQPTAGRRIAGLAHRHGTALFGNDGSRLVLTAAGQRVLARAERIEGEVDAIAREVGGLDERPQGAVRVSAPEALALLFIAPRLPAFGRAYPDIDLVLAAEAPLVELSRREADIALRFVRPRQHSIVVKKLASVRFEPYASPRYLARRPRDGHAVLPSDEFVALHEDLAGSPDSTWLQRHLPGAQVRVRVRTPLAIRAGVIAGAGVGLLGPYVADDPSLRRLTGPPPLVRDLFLAYHRAFRRTTRVQIACRFLVECLKDL